MVDARPVTNLKERPTPAYYSRGSAARSDDARAFFADDYAMPLTGHGYEDKTRTRNPSSSTVVPSLGVMDLSLSDACKYINDHQSLQDAVIICTECYAEKLGGVTHRFLVLELRRANRKTVWLRLDRRRGADVSFLRFVAFSGVTKANDRSLIAASKNDVVGGARAENRQVFKTPPTLHELEVLLAIICEEIVEYRLWPENCWFFCSLIQQHLGEVQTGLFENGSLKYAHIAQRVRTNVARRFWAAKTVAHKIVSSEAVIQQPNPEPPRVMAGVDPQFLRALRKFASGAPFSSNVRYAASEALVQIDQMQAVQSLASLSGSYLCREVIGKLQNLRERFHEARQFAEAVVVMRGAVALQKNLSVQKPSEGGVTLTRLMHCLSDDLYESKCFSDSCAVDEEAIAIIRRLYENRSGDHREHLATTMLRYGVHLSAMGRSEEACGADEESIKIFRELYAQNPKVYSDSLACALHYYGGHFNSLHQYGNERVALDEALSLRRHWVKTDATTHYPGLAKLLDSYAHVLITLGHAKQACEAAKVCIEVHVHLYKHDPAQYHHELIRTANNHIARLHLVGAIEEADVIRNEIKSLRL